MAIMPPGIWDRSRLLTYEGPKNSEIVSFLASRVLKGVRGGRAESKASLSSLKLYYLVRYEHGSLLTGRWATAQYITARESAPSQDRHLMLRSILAN